MTERRPFPTGPDRGPGPGMPAVPPDEPLVRPDDLVATVTGFSRTLRAAGVPADHERTQNLLRALEVLDVTDPREVYWAGRVTLCASPTTCPATTAASPPTSAACAAPSRVPRRPP